MRKNGFAPILILILVLVIGTAVFFFVKSDISQPTPKATPTVIPKTFSRATTETNWEGMPASTTKKFGDMSVTIGGGVEGPGYFSKKIDIKNLSKDYKKIDVSANDFSLLDESKKVIGQPTNGYVDKYISLEKTEIWTDTQLIGNIVFTNVPSSFGDQTITLRYLPEVDGAKPVEVVAWIPLSPAGKPVIYLYPAQIQKTLVKLMFNGHLTFTYPQYDQTIDGWNVTANPDGTIIGSDDKTYSYIFWDGIMNFNDFRFDKGFVVPGDKTSEFLQEILPKIGLIPKEYNEFIVYWTPKLKNNKYNLVYFAGKEYTDNAKLEITPTPDSLLRVYMVYKPLDNPIQIEPQIFPKFERKGFTVVEWGGREL